MSARDKREVEYARELREINRQYHGKPLSLLNATLQHAVQRYFTQVGINRTTELPDAGMVPVGVKDQLVFLGACMDVDEALALEETKTLPAEAEERRVEEVPK